MIKPPFFININLSINKLATNLLTNLKILYLDDESDKNNIGTINNQYKRKLYNSCLIKITILHIMSVIGFIIIPFGFIIAMDVSM